MAPWNFALGGAGGSGYVAAEMKASRTQSALSGFTLIELLVVVAMIAWLGATLLPTFSERKPAYGAQCMSNLKQISLGYLMYASDNQGSFPTEMSSTNVIGACSILEKIHLYVPRDFLYKVVICPVDKSRQVAKYPGSLIDSNVSYFVSLDAKGTNQTSQIVLAGDRDLAADGKIVKPGPLLATTNLNLHWSGQLHAYGGNLSFADGHVERKKLNDFNSVLVRQPAATVRLLVP